MKDEQMTDMDIITLCIALCQVAPALLSYPLVLLSAFSHGWYFSKNGEDSFCHISSTSLLVLLSGEKSKFPTVG